MSSDKKAAALAAKERGNKSFAKKTREGYEEALSAYQEAIENDPDDHVFYANCSACHIELGNDEYEPRKKVESYARALIAARECTSKGSEWAKGYVRQSAAEFELVGAIKKLEERKKQDEKWRKEDEERAEKDRKEGREPFLPDRKPDVQVDQGLKTIVEEASYNSCEASCRKGLELDPQSALLRTRLQALRDAGHPTDEAKDREMRDQTAAGECKAQGNAAFSAKRWKEAIDHYTKAMEQDPFDHVFCSNRSACYAESEEFEKALRDAERCIALNPQFAKGYSRQALALFHVGRYVEMEAAARKGLELDSSSVALQDLLKQAETETRETPEVQAQMHKFRQEKKQDAKMQELMKGLNMQGNNIQMFNPGDDFSGLLNGLKGGGGGFPGMGGFGGSGKARMTEEQMRGMAKAMSQASPSSTGAGYTSAPAETAKPEGPSSFAPQ
jgi:tetratricopeptide (TPR) repeat protein